MSFIIDEPDTHVKTNEWWEWEPDFDGYAELWRRYAEPGSHSRTLVALKMLATAVRREARDHLFSPALNSALKIAEQDLRKYGEIG